MCECDVIIPQKSVKAVSGVKGNDIKKMIEASSWTGGARGHGYGRPEFSLYVPGRQKGSLAQMPVDK